MPGAIRLGSLKIFTTAISRVQWKTMPMRPSVSYWVSKLQLCGIVSLFRHWCPIWGEKPAFMSSQRRLMQQGSCALSLKMRWLVSCVKVKVLLLKTRNLDPSLYVLRKMKKTTSYQPWEHSTHIPYLVNALI